jgi:hypothetical protein
MMSIPVGMSGAKILVSISQKASDQIAKNALAAALQKALE